MIRLRNLRAAWRVLTSRRYVLATSYGKDTTAETLLEGVFLGSAMKLRERGYFSMPRYDMAASIIYDPSVIMLSKGKSGICYASYDCQTEQDFNDLRECKVE